MIADDLKIALQSLETDFAASSDGAGLGQLNEVELPSTVSTLNRGTLLVVGGKEVEIKLTAFIRADEITIANASLPKSGDRFTYDSTIYRVLTVTNDPGKGMYRLELGDKNK